MNVVSAPRSESSRNSAPDDSPFHEEPHGDPCASLHKGSFRVVGWNPGGLPQDNGKEKNAKLRSFINEWSPDVLCLPKIDVAWHMIAHDHRLGERMHAWFPHSRVVTSWYAKYPKLSTARQYGGTAIIVFGAAVGHIVESGQDPTGMGRWSWVKLKGKDGQHFRVVCGYRPVHNTRDPFSVYNQHKHYLETECGDFTTCPRAAFLDDLGKQLTVWKNAGDDVCMNVDLNEDIRKCKRYLEILSEARMCDAIISKHGEHCPPTRRDGSVPIDSLALSTNTLYTGAGYLEFVEGISDHRPSFVDIPEAEIYGKAKQASQKFAARRLKCDDPRVVKRYLKFYDAFLRRHNLYERVYLLAEAVIQGVPLTKKQQKEYEDIDRRRVQGMKVAERKCRNLKVGCVEWSKTLEGAVETHRYWHLTLLRKQGGKISARRLVRLAKTWQITPEPAATEATLKTKIVESWKAYTEVKRNAPVLRAKWVEELAVAKAEEGFVSKATAGRVMAHREKVRKNNKIINRVIRPAYKGGINLVQTKDLNGNVRTHTTKDDIERVGLEEYDRRLRQNQGTPLQDPRAVELLGPKGLSELATEILRTGIVPKELSDIDPFLEDYLAAHKRTTTHYILFELSCASHKQGWKRAREATSSGNSGIHFGHFKAGSQHANITALETMMSGIPWMTGYSPIRWRVGVDVMIEKKPGHLQVQELRTILLLEADFNQGNKKVGKLLMANAEQFGLLAPEQYGSRKFFTAINQGLNKRLTFDILRQKKQRGGLVSTDAMACYDRISHIAASLAMQRAGATKPVIHCMLDTLQRLRHFIKSAYGTSVKYFDADDESGFPIGGTGQGSGASPAIWALVSTPIFDAMRRRGYGVFLTCPITGEMVSFVGYAFVDDTDLGVTDSSIWYDESKTNIFDEIQESVRLWEGFIRVSGGAIRPDKSHWYLIDFEWKEGNWSYKKPRKEDPKLVVRNHCGVYEEIEQVDPSEGRRTVGVRLPPDGTNIQQYEYSLEEVAKWCDKMKSSRLPRSLVWSSLTTRILTKLVYPLPATTFTRQQCYDLMTPLLQVALPTIGVNRHFSRNMVHAPLSCLGLAVPDFYVEQGLCQIQRFLDCPLRAGDITGKLLQVSVETLSFELGAGGNPFALDFKIWGDVATPCWITSLWEFADLYGISLSAPISVIPLQRFGDKYLRDEFVSKISKTSRVLQALNKCRLYLQVARVSDVVSCCGRYVRRDIWNHEICPRKNARCFEWPRQGLPSKRDWQIWDDAIIAIFGLQLPSLLISCSLGRWHQQWDGWEWFVTSDNSELIQLVHDEAAAIQFALRRRDVYETTSTQIHYGVLFSKFPLHRADVTVGKQTKLQSQSVELVYMAEDSVIDFPIIPQEDHNCNRFRQETSWAFQYTYTDVTNETIVEFVKLLQDDGAEAVSDGSDKLGKGSAAWILTFFSAQLAGGFKVLSPEHSVDSYRCELAGLLAILCVVHAAIKIFHLESALVTIACDGESALVRVFDSLRPSSTSDSHWDVIALIQQELRAMPTLTLQWLHVKGHQDDKPYAALDIWARRNILMDRRARECRVVDGKANPFGTWNKLWMVTLDGDPLVRDVKSSIRGRCTTERAKEYWQNKGKLGSATSAEVDWEVLGEVMEELDTDKRRWMTKHSTGWCPVNRNMVRWKFDTFAACPRCGQKEETPLHVWRCQGTTARKIWDSKETELVKWMSKNKTCPAIMKAIRSRLRTWRNNTKRDHLRDSRFHGLRQVVLDQDRLGWEAAFEGKWHVGWAEVQETYFRFIGSQKSGKRWLVALIKKIWLTAWDMWEDRNGVNASRRDAANHRVLQTRVQAEFQVGFERLHRKSQRLFTQRGLLVLLATETQTLESWLLRVESARVWAELEPEVVARETEEEAAKEHRRRIRASAVRMQLRMSAVMDNWLKRD